MFRILAAHPASLRCLRSAVPPEHPRFAPTGLECDAGGQGFSLLRSGYPFPDKGWRRQGLPGSWGTRMRVPCSTTPAGPQRQALRRCAAAFRHLNDVGSRNQATFEAPSHGPRIRCLRFAGWVTPSPRKTRFRLLARLCRAGLNTRWVPSKGFSSYIASPFPRLRLAQSGRSRTSGSGPAGGGGSQRTTEQPWVSMLR